MEWLRIEDKAKLRGIFGGTQKDIFLVYLIKNRLKLLDNRTSQEQKDKIWEEIKTIFNKHLGTSRSVDRVRNRWNRLVKNSKKEVYEMIRKKTNAVRFIDDYVCKPSILSLHVWNLIKPYLNPSYECQDYEREYTSYMQNRLFMENINLHVQDLVDYSENIFNLITNGCVLLP